MEEARDAENWPWVRRRGTGSCCTHLIGSFLKRGVWDLICEKKVVSSRWILHFEQRHELLMWQKRVLNKQLWTLQWWVGMPNWMKTATPIIYLSLQSFLNLHEFCKGWKTDFGVYINKTCWWWMVLTFMWLLSNTNIDLNHLPEFSLSLVLLLSDWVSWNIILF